MIYQLPGRTKSKLATRYLRSLVMSCNSMQATDDEWSTSLDKKFWNDRITLFMPGLSTIIRHMEDMQEDFTLKGGSCVLNDGYAIYRHQLKDFYTYADAYRALRAGVFKQDLIYCAKVVLVEKIMEPRYGRVVITLDFGGANREVVWPRNEVWHVL